MKAATLWADSTYGYLDQDGGAQIQKAAGQVAFPLEHWTCIHGCGLCTKGNEVNARPLEAAPIVIIEMGYNDDDNMNREAARKKMQEQTWFMNLKAKAMEIKQVIFIEQPTYKSADGEGVTGGRFTEDAVNLVREELCIPADKFRVDGRKLYAGMPLEGDGLRQDPETCKAYEVHGKYFTTAGEGPMWIDKEHPSALGAEAHFKLLAAALLEHFKLIFEIEERPMSDEALGN